MGKKTWEFALQSAEGATGQSKRHRIDVNTNPWTGKRTILVDGRRLEASEVQSSGVWGQGSDDVFSDQRS